MKNTMLNQKQFLADFLNLIRRKSLDIKGNHDELWVLMNSIGLSESFNRSTTRILIQFPEEKSSPIILVPEGLRLVAGTPACPNFICEDKAIKGWDRLCPHLFPDLDDEWLEFIVCLLGLFSMPSLCGLMGCEGKDGAADSEQNTDSTQ